jgi:hypothetical protein
MTSSIATKLMKRHQLVESCSVDPHAHATAIISLPFFVNRVSSVTAQSRFDARASFPKT